MLGDVLIGLAGAAVLLLGVRALRADRVMVLALVTLPTIYAVFALVDGDPAKAGLELLVGLPFLVAGAWLYVRGSARDRLGVLMAVAGAFWIAHGLFDVVREDWIGNDGVPGWYPGVCLGVDLPTGVYLLVRSRRVEAADR